MERCREKKLRKNFERNNTLKVENKGFFSMLDQEKREKEKRREREREKVRKRKKKTHLCERLTLLMTRSLMPVFSPS